MIYKCFDIKSSNGAATLAKSETLATQDKSAIKSGRMSNQCTLDLATRQLAELHKPIIRKFEKRKVYLSSKGNIWMLNLEIFK